MEMYCHDKYGEYHDMLIIQNTILNSLTDSHYIEVYEKSIF